MPAPGTRRLMVYTDGSCPFCKWSRQQVERYDREHVVQFRDYNDPAVARETPYNNPELAREMHVLTADRRWHGGYWAWLEVLKALPRWRWLARLLNVIPFRWLGASFYRMVARNRYRVPNLLLRWLGAPPPCPQERACPAPGPS